MPRWIPKTSGILEGSRTTGAALRGACGVSDGGVQGSALWEEDVGAAMSAAGVAAASCWGEALVATRCAWAVVGVGVVGLEVLDAVGTGVHTGEGMVIRG